MLYLLRQCNKVTFNSISATKVAGSHTDVFINLKKKKNLNARTTFVSTSNLSKTF